MSPDAFEEFTQDDLPMLNATMRAFPHVANGFRAVIGVSNALSFPVEGPDQLRNSIAGARYVRYGDSEIPVDDLPELMPPYYFPIESHEDFLSKVADVCARVREPQGVNMPTARLAEAAAVSRGRALPETTKEEILSLAGLREGKTAPGVGGVRRDDN